MEKEKRLALHAELSARGLMSELLARTKRRLGRNKMARNTLYLAFEEGPSTPLRTKILIEAVTLLEDHLADASPVARVSLALA